MFIDRKLEEYSRRLAMELSGWWNLRCRLLCPANFSPMILGEGSRVGRQELGSNLYGALTC